MTARNQDRTDQPFEFVDDDGRPAYAPNGFKLVTESRPKPVALRLLLTLAALVPVPFTVWDIESSTEAELAASANAPFVALVIAGFIAWGLFALANAPDRVQRAVPAQIVPTPPTRPLPTHSSTTEKDH